MTNSINFVWFFEVGSNLQKVWLNDQTNFVALVFVEWSVSSTTCPTGHWSLIKYSSHRLQSARSIFIVQARNYGKSTLINMVLMVSCATIPLLFLLVVKYSMEKDQTKCQVSTSVSLAMIETASIDRTMTRNISFLVVEWDHFVLARRFNW